MTRLRLRLGLHSSSPRTPFSAAPAIGPHAPLGVEDSGVRVNPAFPEVAEAQAIVANIEAGTRL